MLSSGMNIQQIADSMGCNVDSLRTACHRHNISLRQQRVGVDGCGMLSVEISAEVANELRLEARRRGVKYGDLASEIIDAVVGDRLYAAVLDK